jgi:hypothetical protein
MKNTTEARNALSDVYKKLFDKSSHGTTRGEAHLATKIIETMVKSAKAELDQNKFLGRKVQVEFLATEPKKEK